MCVTAKQERHDECVTGIIANIPGIARENSANIGTKLEDSIANSSDWTKNNACMPCLYARTAAAVCLLNEASIALPGCPKKARRDICLRTSHHLPSKRKKGLRFDGLLQLLLRFVNQSVSLVINFVLCLE